MLVHEKIASILGRGYRIKEGTQEDTPDLLGEVNYAKQNIYIKENMVYDQKIGVTCHEIAHCYLYLTGHQEAITPKDAEKWCQFISFILVDFIRNNPDLVEVIKIGK